MIKKTLSSNAKPFNHKRLLPLAISLIALSNATQADDDGMWDMSLEDLAATRVTSIATGTDTPLDKAAAVVSIITEDDISAMGARDIAEVLETIPGMHVGRHPIDYTPKFNIRGITSTYTAETLLLINGIPISSLYFGTPSLVWAGMPVKAIKKIEVIRGPGSALYGADAFAGVINITTKGSEDIPNNQAGASYGSFNTKAGWLTYGNHESEVNLGFTLEYNETDGFEETVDSDLQSFFDLVTGTDASLAPGSTNTGKKMIDMRLELSQKNWTFNLGYQGRDEVESAVGIASALSPNGKFSSDRLNTDFTYTFDNLHDDWKLHSRLSYYYNDQQVEKDNVLFPAGTNAFYPIGTFPSEPAFPNGMIGNPEFREEQARFNLDSEFNGIDSHIIRIGAGYFWGDIYEVTEQKNFDIALTPRPGGLEEVADSAEVFLPEKDRTNGSLYIQDEWLFADNWALTSGVRYDNYSDFGDTVNPRLALVWATTDSITTKFLYGKAFRAPSISELFVTSNPVNLGDPDLKPEKIDTYEVAFSHRLNDKVRYSSNAYYYEINDFISLEAISPTQSQWQNASKRNGYGVELEVDFTPTKEFRLLTNYSYQKSKDDETGQNVGEAPNFQFFARADWKPSANWRYSPQVNFVGEQKRAPGDSRAPVASYATVDFTVKRTEVLDNFELSLSIRNLFDRDVFEASPNGAPVPSIPNDFPMAGRSIYGELAYNF